jgi:hypothetical protein
MCHENVYELCWHFLYLLVSRKQASSLVLKDRQEIVFITQYYTMIL